MIGLVLVAALNCGASATQVDLDECAAYAQSVAKAAETAAFLAAERRFPNNTQLQRSEVFWLDARSSACAFADEMASGGSLEPMLWSQCYADAGQARVRDIALFTGRSNSAALVPSPQSNAEHDRIYGLLELLLSPHERELLARSERFFLWYRDAACSHAQNGCATALTRTRTQQLKDSWLAEKFW